MSLLESVKDGIEASQTIVRSALIALVGMLIMPLACFANEETGGARFRWDAVADPIVTGYKVHWGTASGIYTHSQDAGNVTEAVVWSFAQGVRYFMAVTAYNASGDESDYSTELTFVYDTTTERVVSLEAEDGVLTSPMQVFGDASITWVAASPTDSTAAATSLSFTASHASDFYVWCRVFAPSATSDSLNVTVDQEPELVYHVYGESSPPTSAYQTHWTWSRIQISPGIARSFALAGGSHSIRFRTQEGVLLDRVVIVSSPDFVPTDALPRSGEFLTVVAQPQNGSVSVGGSVTLATTIVATGPVTLQWFHAGVPVPNGNLASLTLSNVQEANRGTYTLSAWTGSATITTQPATLTVGSASGTELPVITTKPNAADIVYGQTLASSSLSGGVASVPGSFAFATPTTAPAAGTASQSVTFTPTNASNYQTVSTDVNVTVSKATPSITTQPVATAITAGQILASSTLSGGAASVPGSFAFTAPGTTPASGTTSHSVTFTPADTQNYRTVTASVSVTVNKTTATVTLGNLATIYDGKPKSASATTDPSGLTVNLTYNGSATAPQTAGSHAVLATIVDENLGGSASGTLVIAKATPSITTQPVATAITDGQILASSTLSGGAASVPGSFAFTAPGTTPASGTASHSVTFTPADTQNYWTVTASVSVTVNTVPIESFVLTTGGTQGSIAGAGTYEGMTYASLSATADSGYVFSGWTGDAAGTNNPLSLLMDAAKTVGALFLPDTADHDRDGLTNYQEIVILGTDPKHVDTDRDGMSDALEDPDYDGLSNFAELNQFSTNPLLADSNADGFADACAICLVGTPYQPRIGNQITFDLKKLVTAGQSIKLLGNLPAGLRFNTATGLITGIISGKPGNYRANVQILQGMTVVRTVPFPIMVLPFPTSLIGNFDCLLEDADRMPSGAFRVTILGANVWTATLESKGAAIRSARGSFILGEGSPTAPITAVFPAAAGAPAVTVHLSIDGTHPSLTGSYSAGTLRGFRLASGTELPAATNLCRLVLDAGERDGIFVPAGIGWMIGSVAAETGVISLKGLLGDGADATFNLRLSPSGQAVLWAQPYTNKNSYIGGIVTLDHLGQPASDQTKLTDGVWWAKAADAATLSYPQGFPPIPLTIGTGNWTVPANASALGASLGWRGYRTASVIIDGAGLSNQDQQTTPAVLPTEFTIDEQFNLAVSAPINTPSAPWIGGVVQTDGSFTGTLAIPSGFSSSIPAGAAAVSGVLVQEDFWADVSGCGLIKVPVPGAEGSFVTAGFIVGQ